MWSVCLGGLNMLKVLQLQCHVWNSLTQCLLHRTFYSFFHPIINFAEITKYYHFHCLLANQQEIKDLQGLSQGHATTESRGDLSNAKAKLSAFLHVRLILCLLLCNCLCRALEGTASSSSPGPVTVHCMKDDHRWFSV